MRGSLLSQGDWLIEIRKWEYIEIHCLSTRHSLLVFAPPHGQYNGVADQMGRGGVSVALSVRLPVSGKQSDSCLEALQTLL